jgi:general secretion pathway protein N
MTMCRIAVALAMSSFAFNGASGQVATGVSLKENDPGQTRPDAEVHRAAPRTPGGQEAPRGGNPLWGVPLSALTATRDRPLFAATRRPPPPVIKAEALPAPPPPPPPPPEPEKPRLALVGTVTGEPQGIAVVRDQDTSNLVRVHVGEAVSGWFLRSVDERTMTVEKNSQTVTLALPERNSAPTFTPGGPLPVQQAFRMRRQF